MDFPYVDYFQRASGTGYETLIYDFMIGDATLFQRSDNVIAGWEIVEPLLNYRTDAKAPLAARICPIAAREGLDFCWTVGAGGIGGRSTSERPPRAAIPNSGGLIRIFPGIALPCSNKT
jgi:Glucose-6-phosphate dehydrogenase, C-terminal domain